MSTGKRGITSYTDDDRETYVALAQEIGIAPAIRRLGYPTVPSAHKWLKARNIRITVSSLMAEVKRFHHFYDITEMLVVVETGVARVVEMYTEDNLSPDDMQKAATATAKLVNSWLLLQGKSTSISETRESDALDVALVDLLNAEKARNLLNQDANKINNDLKVEEAPGVPE